MRMYNYDDINEVVLNWGARGMRQELWNLEENPGQIRQKFWITE
jgi:hypothetical protein